MAGEVGGGAIMTQKCPYCGMNLLGTESSLVADCCEYGDYLFNRKIDKTIVDKAFDKKEKIGKGDGMNSAQFYEAIQEQHPELVPVIDRNKSAAFDAVLQKCRELGMVDNYNVPMLDNVLEFIESLAKDVMA